MSSKPGRGSSRSRRKSRDTKYSLWAKPKTWRELNAMDMKKRAKQSHRHPEAGGAA